MSCWSCVFDILKISSSGVGPVGVNTNHYEHCNFLPSTGHLSNCLPAATSGKKSFDVQKPFFWVRPSKTGDRVGLGKPMPRKIALFPWSRRDWTVISVPKATLYLHLILLVYKNSHTVKQCVSKCWGYICTVYIFCYIKAFPLLPDSPFVWLPSRRRRKVDDTVEFHW